jgi:hypothetical protein
VSAERNADGDIWLMNLKVDPIFAKLRSQRKFTDTLARIRFRTEAFRALKMGGVLVSETTTALLSRLSHLKATVFMRCCRCRVPTLPVQYFRSLVLAQFLFPDQSSGPLIRISSIDL